MSGECFGNVSGAQLAAIYAVGLMFGIGFNAFTGWARKVGMLKGRTSLFVAAGVLVTLALTAIISLPFTLMVVGAFVATGTPMIVGDLWRAWRDEQAAMALIREDAKRNGNPR